MSRYLHWQAPAGHVVHAGAALGHVPQQLFFAFEQTPVPQQPAANTVTTNIPANSAFFIVMPLFSVPRAALCDLLI
jgi:hypothetical protein